MNNIANIRKHGQDSSDIRNFNISPNQFIQTVNHNQDTRESRPRKFLDLGLPVQSLHRPVGLEEGIFNGTVQNNTIEEEETEELELTLGLGPSSSKSTRRTNTDSAATLSNSSSTESSHMKRPEPATFLSTRNSSKEELIGWQWGLNHHHHHPSSSRRNGASIEDMKFRQDRHTNPPWLFQALSLNTT
ncbi:OLC1v1011496C2 [Oldenlandia corymbosa var. corymbosa]|nr:OLC1v1011496C2 [Oldenlandia corymbosa var. corymbosa]